MLTGAASWRKPSASNLVVSRPERAFVPLAGGRTWWAHFELTHVNITPTVRKKIEDWREASEDEKHVLQFATGHALASIGRLFTTARSRIAEDALSVAVERGIRQIVILGAGLDTFALRSPYDARQIRIYEVDHPATQGWKRQRLDEAQLALRPWLILVPVDFERDALGETLVGAGFQRNSPAFFSWLGVVPYLTQDAIGSTLDYMASTQSSEVVFDYMNPPGILHQHDIVLLEHWQERLFELTLPQLALIESIAHRMPRLKVWEAAHEEGVSVVEREKRAQDLHADVMVSRHRFGAKQLEKSLAPTGLVLYVLISMIIKCDSEH